MVTSHPSHVQNPTNVRYPSMDLPSHLLPTYAIILPATSLGSLPAATHIADHINALASNPMACFITSLSFSLIGLVSCPMPALSPNSHCRDIRTVRSVILIGPPVACNGAFRLRLDTSTSTHRVPCLRIPAVRMDWNLFGGTLLAGPVMKSDNDRA